MNIKSTLFTDKRLQQIQEELDRATSIFEESPNPIVQVTGEGKLKWMNRAAEHFCGREWHLKPGQTVGKELLDILHKDKTEKKTLHAELACGKRTFWVMYKLINGYINVYARDITNHKKIEEALRESETRYRRLFENMNEGFALAEMIWDEDGNPVDWRYLEVNDAWTQTGIPVSKTVGRTAREINPETDPACIEAYGRVVKTGNSIREESYVKGLNKWFAIFTFKHSENRFALLVFDITERKQTEAALEQAKEAAEEKERIYNAMMEHIPMGIIIADAPDVNIRNVSRFGREQTGQHFRQSEDNAAEPPIKKCDIYHADGITPASDEELPLTRAIRKGEIVKDEVWVLGPSNGRRFPILCTAAPIWDEQHHITGGVIGWQDITDRIRSEEAMRQSEAKFRAFFEQAAIGMGRVRFDNARWIDVNDTFCRMLGYNREEMLKTPWFEITHPDDVDLDLTPFKHMAAGELENYSVEKRFIHKQGHFVWARLTLSLVRDAEGKPDYEVAIIEDITRQKRAQEALESERARLQAVLDSLPVAVWFADQNGTVIQTNRAVDQIWGKPEFSYVKQAGEYKGWLADSGEPIQAEDWALTRAALKGEVSTGEVITIQRFDGSFGTILYNASPVKDREGRVIGGVAVAQDITDRKQTEDALKEATEHLEQRVNERTAEVQAKARQLRALTVQLSQAEHQERKRLAKVLHDHLQQLIVAARLQIGWLEYGDDLEYIHTTAREASVILQEAIAASRNLAVDLSPPILHQAGLIGALEWLVTDLQKKHQFEVKLNLEQTAEPAFEELQVLLFESVRELLLNAVKHSGVSRAQVSLSNEDGTVHLIVSDEGKGFDPTILRTRGADNESFGLFSIQERLLHIGGEMILESDPGKGTRVTLVVPNMRWVKEDEPTVFEPKKTKKCKAVTVRHRSDLCRVLIVDDHKIMRQGLVKLFRSEPGIEVIGEAEDGLEAVEKADQLRPDVIIMDVNLDQMNGVEATRRIVEHHPEIKVIGLSMHADQAVADSMLSAGACAYYTKSEPSEELLTAVFARKRPTTG